MMEAINTHVTSAIFYEAARRNVPRNSLSIRRENQTMGFVIEIKN